MRPHEPSSGRDAISGLIERITFHNEESGFVVLRVQVKGRRDLVTVVGRAAAVHAGEWITAEGEWVRDRDHGLQLRASQLETQAPNSREGIEKYLGSGLIHGIGPVLAKRLVARFGEQVFDIIENHSARLEEVEGVGSEKRRSIKSAWQEQRVVRDIMVFLHTHGIGTSRAVRIYRVYGDDAIACIRSDPYRLARDIAGIGFLSADGIGKKIGISHDSLLRIRAGIDHVLAEGIGDGHCALPRAHLVEATAKVLGLDAPLVEDALKIQLSAGALVAEMIDGTELIFLPALRAAEELVAARLLKLNASPANFPRIDVSKALDWVRERNGIALSETQESALRLVLNSRVAVVTGGPGVGKTTLINSILKILRAKGVRCALCAPTGRAAKRMAESTAMEAKTIHRLLAVKPGGGFQRDETNPIEGDLLVVDEVSMVDLPLMARLLRALPPNGALLLVGDSDQLPSVGPGSVLRDVIASGRIPIARLLTVFRQAERSRIVNAAHAVNEGRVPELSAAPDADFYFIEREAPEDAAALIEELVVRRIPQHYGFDPRRDIQVLSPMNRGATGVRNLNLRLQAAMNPGVADSPVMQSFGVSFRAGDKIIQTRNNYDKDVYNGDIGVVVRVLPDERRVVTEFDGREVRYDFGEMDEVEIAYAITVHKSQGSEFPCVIIPVVTEHYLLLQRNLLYTAITRGKQLVVLVGQKKALAMAVRNNTIRRRHSGLFWRMRERAD